MFQFLDALRKMKYVSYQQIVLNMNAFQILLTANY